MKVINLLIGGKAINVDFKRNNVFMKCVFF